MIVLYFSSEYVYRIISLLSSFYDTSGKVVSVLDHNDHSKRIQMSVRQGSSY